MHPYLKQLEQELGHNVISTAAQIELATLQTAVVDGPLATASSWQVIREFVDAVRLKSAATDSVLYPMLRAAKRDGLPEVWQAILLYTCWSGLTMITCWRTPNDEDQPEAFAELTWAFYRVIHQLDLEDREQRIGQKIVNDIDHHLRAAMQAERRSLARFDRRVDFRTRLIQVDMRPATHNGRPVQRPRLSYGRRERRLAPRWIRVELPLQSFPGEDIDPLEAIASCASTDAEFVFADERRHALAQLWQLKRNDSLSRADFLILVGCCLYGQSLDLMAKRLGVSYDAAKAQRLRAIARVEKCAPDLSPSSSDSPLYVPERAHPSGGPR